MNQLIRVPCLSPDRQTPGEATENSQEFAEAPRCPRMQSSLCCRSGTQSCLTLLITMDDRQASLSFTISPSLLKLVSIESVIPSSHLILCRPLLCLSSVCPRIRVFCKELALCIRRPKDWSFSISASNEHSGLISFTMDRLNLLAVQGALKSLLNTTVQKHQIFSTQSSLWSNSHIWKNHSFD